MTSIHGRELGGFFSILLYINAQPWTGCIKIPVWGVCWIHNIFGLDVSGNACFVARAGASRWAEGAELAWQWGVQTRGTSGHLPRRGLLSTHGSALLSMVPAGVQGQGTCAAVALGMESGARRSA